MNTLDHRLELVRFVKTASSLAHKFISLAIGYHTKVSILKQLRLNARRNVKIAYAVFL